MDALEIVDEFGADALRFTLTQMAALGGVLKLSEDRIKGYRNFGTKLWNATRFAEMNEVYANGAPTKDIPQPTQTVNKWIVAETARARIAFDNALDQYRFNDAANGLYAHIWGVLCDWYIEFAKPLLDGDGDAKAETQATMAWALDQAIILIHPIMPFITEELWSLTGTRAKPLIHADWPTYGEEYFDADASDEMNWVIGVIEQIRSVRSEMNLNAGAKTALIVAEIDETAQGRLDRNAPLIQRRARVETIEHAPVGKGAVTLSVPGAVMALPLAEFVDIEAEKKRLDKAMQKIAKDIGGLKGKLGNEKFLANAKAEVVEEQKERLVAAEAEAAKLEAALARLAGLA